LTRKHFEASKLEASIVLEWVSLLNVAAFSGLHNCAFSRLRHCVFSRKNRDLFPSIEMRAAISELLILTLQCVPIRAHANVKCIFIFTYTYKHRYNLNIVLEQIFIFLTKISNEIYNSNYIKYIKIY
jgi:hypothetical protein